jgi:putative ABC transport system permease protein
MTRWKLLRRNLVFYRKSFSWIIAGAALSTAVFVGALVVGDSVKFSLREMVSQRLGKTRLVMSSGDRFFRQDLAGELSSDLDVQTAPLLSVRGTASSEGGLRRANRVQVVGVDGRFGEMGGAADAFREISEDEAVVNLPLARRLGLEEGGEMVLRVENLDTMPRETPLALDSETSLAVRLTVRHIASDKEFGRFNLLADQVTPPTAFLSLEALSRLLELEDRANVILIAGRQDAALDRRAIRESTARLWSLDDAGLSLALPAGRNVAELRSSRVFIHPAVVEAGLKIDPVPEVILTYFVNEIARGEKSTPYSFVSAPGAPILPADMPDDEILVNSWLAEDLDARPGDEVTLSYFVPGGKGALKEQSAVFKVRGIVPLAGIYADRDLLPEFPGLAEIESTRDWRPGIPIDLGLVRDKDERYWEEHRGTPKAFVTLTAARRLWRNRFGSATALRFPGTDPESVGRSLLSALSPSDLGFEVRDVREEGLNASARSVDFGQLFLGLSFFIIVAGLLLTSLLFVFSVEKRADENGLLMAVGFSRRMVRRLNLSEGALLALAGSLLGGLLGLGFNQVVLAALETVWKGAVGTSSLAIHVRPLTVLAGCTAGFMAALLTIWLTGRKQLKTTITGLLRGMPRLDLPWKKGPRLSLWVMGLSLAASAFIIAGTDFERGREAFGAFFSAGMLLLVGGLAFLNVVLLRLGRSSKKGRLGLFRIGVRGMARRRLRSLTLVGLLACGLFIVFTVGANRLNSLKDADKRDSGTGGFAFFGETAIPVYQDLNSAEGRARFGLDGYSGADLSFVQFRVLEGEDASCLNLNHVSRPQMIGVAPDLLSDRGAFRFVKWTEDVDPDDPWAVLDKELKDGSLPAVADNTVIIWGLGKSVGDTLSYESEEGETFTVRLVGGLDNSVFQGNVIISEKAFLEKFPSLSGSRLFLAEAAPAVRASAAEVLRRLMQDRGLELVSSADRLAEFNRVENTYLSIFLILGSFGLVLGSLGLGIVVRRTIRERQGELSLLRAVGFDRRAILKLVLSEHLYLLAAGILLGLTSAFAATLPAVLAPGSEIPWLTIGLLLAAAVINGAAWTLRAAALETRGNLLTGLRGE